MAHKDNVLTEFSGNIAGYWPFDELTGTVADCFDGVAAKDGEYHTSVVLADTAGPFDGTLAPLFSAGGVDIYSSEFNTAFNQDELTISFWAKEDVSSSGYYIHLRDNSTNFVYMRSLNDIRSQRTAQSITTVSQPSVTDLTIWNHFLMTISVTDDEHKLYINGVLQTIPSGTVGAWRTFDNLDDRYTVIGAFRGDNQSTPIMAWLQHVLILDKVVTQAEVDKLYTGVFSSGGNVDASIVIL